MELGPYIDGVNLVDPVTKLKNSEMSLCRNLRTGNRGDFYKRPGHDHHVPSNPQKINGDALVNFNLRFYKSDGTKRTIAAAGGKLRYIDDGTGIWTDISINGTGASMHATNLCEYIIYKNRLYLCDGTAVQRYNLTDNIYAGHFSHAAPTLSSQATGGALTLLGTYKYRVVSLAGDMGLGPYGAELSVTLTGGNNRINLSGMADAPAKYEETFRYVFRTKANETEFFLLTILSPGTSTYQDNTADTALGDAYVPVHAPRADSRFVIMGHDDRAYWFGRAGVNASVVEVSDVGFPDRIIDTDFLGIANNDGDILTGAGLSPSGVVFFKRRSVWLQREFGYGLINLTPKDKRGEGQGSVAPFSIIATPIGLIWLSQRGQIYKFDGAGVDEIGFRIASEFSDMTTAALARVVACYHKYRYIISYDRYGNTGYNRYTLEYDTRLDKWEGPHENGDFYNPSYYAVWDAELDKGELSWGEAKAANGSYIYVQRSSSFKDRGNKFHSLMRSGRLKQANLGEVLPTKVFVDGEFSTDATLKFTVIDDLEDRTSVVLNIPVNASGFILGTSQLGSGTLAGFTSTVLEKTIENVRARRPMYELSDEGTATTAKITDIALLAKGLELK